MPLCFKKHLLWGFYHLPTTRVCFFVPPNKFAMNFNYFKYYRIISATALPPMSVLVRATKGLSLSPTQQSLGGGASSNKKSQHTPLPLQAQQIYLLCSNMYFFLDRLITHKHTSHLYHVNITLKRSANTKKLCIDFLAVRMMNHKS